MSSGEPELAATHYVDAIVRAAPTGADELVELVEWINREMVGLPRGHRTSMSMSPEARARFDQVLAAMADVGYSRKGKDVMSAVALKLLRQLNAEGPMPKRKQTPLVF
ncbi:MULTISPECIES: hypothetical protein [unclassified Streptomyces]|uniref:hypothetical protein n=1 Tax=unclassified Streptomyces TaxID=2593676 RepID=UPI00382E752F